ncbi:MAG: tetratricopeptide repeat protein [Flavobacteriaceae bacterium]
MEDFRNEDHQFALSKFESMLQLNKIYFFDSEEFEEIVYFYMDNGKMNLANKAITLSLTQHPTSISLKLIKVELLIYEKKFKEAERMLFILENSDPTFDEIYIQKASIFSKNENHKEAIKQLQKALLLTDDIADVNALLGMEYLFIEEFDLSRMCFYECLDFDIEDYAALYNIIYCFDMLDKNSEAVTFLLNYIEKNPYSEVAWHQLGKQYVALKSFNEAIRSYDYAILIDELFIGAYIEKAKVLEEIEDYKSAISNYMIAIELDDPTAYTYLQIGICYVKLKKPKLAIDFYKKAIDEDPMLDKAWLMLVNLYVDNDNPEKASYVIKRALEIDPDNFYFLNRLAEINIRLNLFEEGAVAFQKSLQLGDTRLELFLALADVLHYIGDYDKAETILLKADKIHPNTPEISYRLSGFCFLQKKNREGLFYLENGLKMNFFLLKIIEEFFPEMLQNNEIIQLISKFQE